MLGLVLVTVAITGSLIIRAFNAMVRGREFRINAEDLAWYAIALALVTDFYGLIPNSLYSASTALGTVDRLLSAYNGLIGSLSLADAMLSIAVNVGLPIAEAAMYVTAGSGLGSITLVTDVVEHLIALVINYVVHVLSMLVAALWLIRYAVIIGKGLRLLMPYVAFFLVIPRARDVAIIPAALYLVLGVALPLGINTAHLPPLVMNSFNETQTIPNGLGFTGIEVVDELGRPVPAILCIGGYGFPYNETIGLPNGAGVVALPIYMMRMEPVLYRVYCVVSLFIRFGIDKIIMPGIYPNAGAVIIRLPMIAVFNEESLVALFNYTWIGAGNVNLDLGNGYAIINVTTCQGNLTLTAYATQVILKPIRPVDSNCSITYSITEGVPVNLVPQSWVESIIRGHELLCRDLEQVINPLTMYQGFTAPPQVVNAILGMVNDSCGSPGDYASVIHEVRSIRVSASFRCRGACNGAGVSVLVIGVEPYNLNYYALWSGTYITWLGNSLMIIRNAELNPFSLGTLINIFIATTYYSALLLGLISMVAMAPRIRYWARLMGIVRVRLGINYEDTIAIADSATSIVARSAARHEDLVRRHAMLRRAYELARRRYVKHALRTMHWVVRDLPRVAAAPHIVLPALYGTSLAREHVMRRVSMIERESLRNALRSVAGIALSPSLVLRPYSLVNPLFRQGVNALARYVGLKVSDASRVYGALRSYLGPGIALYVALKAVLKSVDGYVVSAVDEVWRSLNKPLDALALISARFGALRLIERDLTTLVVGEALRELLNRHGPLTNVKVMINNSVVRPEEVLKLDDYADVVIATNGESTFVKAWVVKELLRAMGSVRT